ncbi:hypothetical protein FOL47_002003, partial [Perkinsus chesapeaki]
IPVGPDLSEVIIGDGIKPASRIRRLEREIAQLEEKVRCLEESYDDRGSRKSPQSPAMKRGAARLIELVSILERKEKLLNELRMQGMEDMARRHRHAVTVQMAGEFCGHVVGMLNRAANMTDMPVGG